MKKFEAILVVAFLTAASLASVMGEDDERDRGDGGDNTGTVEPPTRREVVTETVYLPDPETEKKLADALAELDGLKIELALLNTTLQYSLDEGKTLRGELEKANAKISRLSSDISVLRSYEEKKPTLDTTTVMDIYGDAYANGTGNANADASAAASYPQPVERPFPFNILASLNLI